MMTATLVNKISRPEEGKRYLNLNYRIIFDIKQAFKKCGNHLKTETVDMLHTILDRLEPQYTQNISVSYCRKTNDKGNEKKLKERSPTKITSQQNSNKNKSVEEIPSYFKNRPKILPEYTP